MGQIVSDVSDVLDYQKDKKVAASTRKQILADMEQDEQTKTNLVKKALATQRAKYGAAGVSGGTSAGAVLKRLQSETEQPYDEKRKNNLTKLQSTKAKKPNLLKSLLSRFDELVS